MLDSRFNDAIFNIRKLHISIIDEKCYKTNLEPDILRNLATFIEKLDSKTNYGVKFKISYQYYDDDRIEGNTEYFDVNNFGGAEKFNDKVKKMIKLPERLEYFEIDLKPYYVSKENTEILSQEDDYLMQTKVYINRSTLSNTNYILSKASAKTQKNTYNHYKIARKYTQLDRDNTIISYGDCNTKNLEL